MFPFPPKGESAVVRSSWTRRRSVPLGRGATRARREIGGTSSGPRCWETRARRAFEILLPVFASLAVTLNPGMAR